MRARAVLGILALLTACSTVPEAIRTPAPGDVRVAEVRAEPERFVGTTVRWGGTLATVRNEPETTVLEIVARRLDSSGQPREEDKSEGRFRARVTGFLDPAIYTQGREITVRGTVAGAVEEAIGEFRYRYPLVNVEQLHLWAPRPPPLPPYPYYGPYWWSPAYPWGWPYYPPYRY